MTLEELKQELFDRFQIQTFPHDTRRELANRLTQLNQTYQQYRRRRSGRSGQRLLSSSSSEEITIVNAADNRNEPQVMSVP